MSRKQGPDCVERPASRPVAALLFPRRPAEGPRRRTLHAGGRATLRAWGLAVVLMASLLVAACGGGDDRATTVGSEALPRVTPPGETGPEATTTPPVPGPSLGKLVYVRGGDIWVKALPDGEPRRLTTDGRNREPRWSPSGRWLAFRKGAGDSGETPVWVMAEDGGDAYPLDEGATVGAFAWAPRQDRLAYLTSGALVAVDADGADRRELVAGDGGRPGTGVLHSAWSPDGQWLAYDRLEVMKEGEGGYPPERYAGLWRVGADGGGASELLNAGSPSEYGLITAGWSPDSSYILYWVDPQFSASLLADGAPLYALAADGGTPVRLAEAVLHHPDFLAPAPTDSGPVAVIVGGYRGTWTGKRAFVWSPSAGWNVVPLSSPDMAASSPSWSPDGQRIAYVAMPDGDDYLAGGEPARQALMERHMFVVNSEGQPQPEQLTVDPNHRDEHPLWSADGAFILFARLDADGRASLWLVPAQGEDAHQVVDELAPAPEPAPLWFGYYGHVDWDGLYDWWQGQG